MTKTCPVCEKRSVNVVSVIAAAFRSESRCAACGSAVRYGTSAELYFLAAALFGFAVGLLVENFVIAAVVAVVVVVAFVLRLPLEADETDSIAADGLFRKRIRRQNAQNEKAE